MVSHLSPAVARLFCSSAHDSATLGSTLCISPGQHTQSTLCFSLSLLSPTRLSTLRPLPLSLSLSQVPLALYHVSFCSLCSSLLAPRHPLLIRSPSLTSHPCLSPLLPFLLGLLCSPLHINRDDADLYDAFGNYLGGDLDSGSDSGSEAGQAPLDDEQQQQDAPLRAYDEDEEMAQEPLEGMEVDGELEWYISWL